MAISFMFQLQLYWQVVWVCVTGPRAVNVLITRPVEGAMVESSPSHLLTRSRVRQSDEATFLTIREVRLPKDSWTRD